MTSSIQIRRIGRVVNGGTPTPAEENWDGDVPWATPIDLGRRHGAFLVDTARHLSETGLQTGSSLVPTGSVLLSTRAPIGYLARSAVPIAFNQGCRAIVPTADLDARFLVYALMHSGPELQNRGQGTTFLELTGSSLAAIEIPWAPVASQRDIADFLDRETAQIDDLIAKQKALIELLGERRKAVITRTVTKGVEPSVPMKESGVEWLGSIPAHWSRMAFKYAATLLPGYSFPSEMFSHDESSVRLLRGINVGLDRVNWTDAVYWADEITRALQDYSLGAGDLVLGLDRPIISGGVRVAEMHEDDLPALLVQRVARIRPKHNARNGFLRLVLLANGFPSYLAPIFTGVSVPHLSTDQVGSFPIALPPMLEQALICEHLAIELQQIGLLEVKADAVVAALLERRSALITAAVTGKIDVRGAA